MSTVADPAGELTPEQCVAAVHSAVNTLGGGFMLSPATHDAGRSAGYRSWAFYFGGRGGVLGPADATVVDAVFAFFPSDRVRKSWESAAAVAPPARTTELYAQTCQDWGRAHLAEFPGLDRLSELAGRVVAAADVVGVPLFAGWRALPMPEEPAARLAHLLHLLREYRGGKHTAAVVAAGLDPLEAVLAGPRGAADARFLGWPEPYPDVGDARERRALVEAATDALDARAYAVLSGAERAELAVLVQAARAHVFPAG